MKKRGNRGGLTRRELLQLGAAAASVAVVGCGDDSSGADDGGAADASVADANAPDSRPDAAADARVFSGSELLEKIDTFVVLCMENRSFDHYLGSLKLAEGKAVDGLTGNEQNLDSSGAPVKVFRLDNYTPADPPHGWDQSHNQWNFGQNDGFVTEHAGASQNDVMGYHVRAQLPSVYGLADNFTVCDRWFCSVLGPTWPNRFYLHGATSKGIKANTPATGFRSIFAELDDKGISHKNYYHDVAWASGAYFKRTGLARFDKFIDDAAAGTLPQFSLIDPGFFTNANDDHPSHDIRLGQALIATVFNALAKSPQWGRCMFVVTYDEHGGFYDHAQPPAAVDDQAGFDRLGFRVPALVAGPFVKKNAVVSTTFDHVSVIATLTTRYGLTPLNARVSATSDLSSCIEPSFLMNPQVARELPPVQINRTALFSRPPRSQHHEELGHLADIGVIPRHLDHRNDPGALERWVRAAVKLGAIELT